MMLDVFLLFPTTDREKESCLSLYLSAGRRRRCASESSDGSRARIGANSAANSPDSLGRSSLMINDQPGEREKERENEQEIQRAKKVIFFPFLPFGQRERNSFAPAAHLLNHEQFRHLNLLRLRSNPNISSKQANKVYRR